MDEGDIRILLVEDNPGDARLLREALLDAAGQVFTLTQAQRLDQAIGLVGGQVFDVVLLDMSLPDTQGPDTVRRMAAAAPHIPVVVLTGTDDVAVGTEALRGGAQDYLVKGQTDHRLLIRSIRYAIERHRAEEALRQSEQRERQRAGELAAVLEAIPIPVFIAHDADCVHMIGNRLANEILRIAPGKELSLSGLPDTKPRHFRVLKDGRELRLDELPAQRAARGENVHNVEFTLAFDDGVVREVLGYGTPLLDERGVPRGTVAALVDITERKQAEERYRTLFSTLLEGFCVIEVLFDADARPIDYRFLEINPAFAAQTGLHDAQGKLMRELAPDHEAHWFEIYGRVALTGQPVRFVNEARALNRWFDVSAYRVGGPDSRKVAILFNDITEAKTAEKALQAAKVVAEAASKAKDQFLAVLSHELRNPLNPVLATAELLLRDPRFDADTRDLFAGIARNVELEARLIDDLLDVTRIERGKVELHCDAIELGATIRRAVEVCLPDIQARKLEFAVDAADGPYHLEADGARLQQVFWNLLKNSIKFTPAGGSVGIRCRRDGAFVEVQVNDSGAGIAPENLERIFNAFEQASRSVTRQFGGLGLGLTICRAMVELHGGTIKASSPGRGRGATFTVRLPMRAARVSDGGAASVIGAAPAARVHGTWRILLVEDHSDTAKVMARFLRMDGYSVAIASDVASAMKLASESVFDLLLSDLGLPDGSGLDLMRSLRAGGHAFPGIALTGYGQESDVQECRDAGFDTHLTKPIDIARLNDAIENIRRSRTATGVDGKEGKG